MADFGRTRKNFSDIFTFTRSSDGTYFNQSGQLVTAPNDTARFQAPYQEVITTGNRNSLLWNRTLTDGVWNNNADVTQDETGVDGTENKAWTVVDDRTNNGEYIRQALTIPDDSNPITCVYFIKKELGTQPWPQVFFQMAGGSTAISCGYFLNKATGEIKVRGDVGLVPADSTSVELVNGFWKVALTISNNGTGNTNGTYQVNAAAATADSDLFDTSLTGSCVYDQGQIYFDSTEAGEPVETQGSPVPVTITENKSGGLLMEAQTTNSLLWNRDLLNAAWAGAVQVAQDQVGIDGAANTAWTVTDDSVVVNEFFTQDVTVSNNSDPVTLVFNIKKTSGATTSPVVEGLFSGGTTTFCRYGLNTDTGAVTRISGSVEADQIKVYSRGDFWAVEMTFQNNSSGNTNLGYTVYVAASTPDSDTTDVSLTGSCVWDFGQVELNRDNASSPIFTEGTAVTRQQDRCVDTTLNWFSSEEFTLYMEFTPTDNSRSDPEYYLNLDGGAFDFYVICQQFGLTNTLRVQSKADDTAITEDFDYSDTVKLAVSYKTGLQNTIRFCLNGDYRENPNNSSNTMDCTELNLGNIFNGALPVVLAGFQNFQFWPSQLTEAELISLTS